MRLEISTSMKKNKLVLVSGHSGSGKTTVMRKTMFHEILSFTTRERRPKEIDGVDYKFITLNEFKVLKSNNKLLEWTEYSGNFYGVMSNELNKLKEHNVFFICDYNGMKQAQQFYDNCVSIFMYTDIVSAQQNLGLRGESLEFINKRLSTYDKEIENKKYYDYVIKNNSGKLDHTIRIVKEILYSEGI